MPQEMDADAGVAGEPSGRRVRPSANFIHNVAGIERRVRLHRCLHDPSRIRRSRAFRSFISEPTRPIMLRLRKRHLMEAPLVIHSYGIYHDAHFG